MADFKQATVSNDYEKKTFRCKNCKELKYKYQKESLSDKELDIKELYSGYLGLYPEKDVKEKIQNAHRRLRTEMHLTISNSNIMDTIFKEEFGDKLNGTN